MKNYLIAFLISLLLLSTIGTGILMLMIPKTTVDINYSPEEYKNVNSEEYKFENSKNITNERSEKKYVVSSDALASFKRKYMYKPGNVNPFSSEIDIYNEWVENQKNDNTDDKTDNSNDGNGNSSHTGK